MSFSWFSKVGLTQFNRTVKVAWPWWRTPLISGLGRHNQVYLWVWSQPMPQGEFQDSQGYTQRNLVSNPPFLLRQATHLWSDKSQLGSPHSHVLGAVESWFPSRLWWGTREEKEEVVKIESTTDGGTVGGVGVCLGSILRDRGWKTGERIVPVWWFLSGIQFSYQETETSEPPSSRPDCLVELLIQKEGRGEDISIFICS